ncbi:hypothetical protein GGR51DRAFT_563738 [Nemania sp. FL0031]|nr:hypothetical protein GGR51DRAFT_563738 [Nemania sp. FL0031]
MTLRTLNNSTQPEVEARPSQDASEASEAEINQDNLQTTLETIVDHEKAKVDIVVVHGLNPVDGEGHAGDTWTDDGKLWLRDFLPKRAPPMRVLLFGYNSRLTLSSIEFRVAEVAKNLLGRINNARADHGRPLIFICHSLGGLIVKKAIIMSQSNASYNEIRTSTYGVAFFGTPHWPRPRESWGDVAEKIAQCVLGNPEGALAEALQQGLRFAESWSTYFQTRKLEYKIISFHEARECHRLGLIVDRGSAIIGPPYDHESVIELDADHGGICKFQSAEDPTYQAVETNLFKMIRNAINYARERATRNISSVMGEMNFISQVGGGNRSTTKGDSNHTRQIGRGNRGNITGSGNMVYQESTPALHDNIRYILIKLQVPTLLSWVSKLLAFLSSRPPTTPANPSPASPSQHKD